ncbi:MAG: YidC/Oxa1 family membrane protein insertase [Candidatus Woykebacteria bacterium]
MFDFFINAWNLIVYQPVLNLVVFSYNLSPGPNFGITIIGLAILIRFIFLHFTLRSYEQDKALEKVKPLIDQIETDKKLTSREKIEKVSAITKPHGINPFLESIPIFAQVIFLIALYQILQVGIINSGYGHLYSFVKGPDVINTLFFGFDLTHPAFILSFIAAVVLFVERMWEYNEKKHIGFHLSDRWDPLILPVISFIILMLLPSAKAVFVATSVGFSLAIKTIMHAGRRG